MPQELSVSVRRATAADAGALADLVNRAFAIEAYFVEGDRTNAVEIAAMMETGTFLVLDGRGLPPAGSTAGGRCGVLDGRGLPPAGSTAGGRCGVLEHAGEVGATIYVERGGYFGMLSVLPELQNHGLGKRLVRIAEALCEAAGCETMSLRIINLREELGRWYRSLGYREVGTTPYTHRGVKRPCHFVEMQRPLRVVETLAA